MLNVRRTTIALLFITGLTGAAFYFLGSSAIREQTLYQTYLERYGILKDRHFWFDGANRDNWVVTGTGHPKNDDTSEQSYAVVGGERLQIDHPEINGVRFNGHRACALRVYGRSRIFFDGKQIAELKPDIADTRVSRDSKTVFFIAKETAYKMIDGKLSQIPRSTAVKEFPDLDLQTQQHGDKTVLLYKGKQIDSAKFILNYVTIQPGEFAYWKTDDGKKWQLIIDGKLVPYATSDTIITTKDGRPFNGGDLYFSENHTDFYVIAYRNGRKYLYTKKGLVDSAPEIWGVEISPDGSKIGYTVQNNPKAGMSCTADMHAKVDGKDVCIGNRSRFMAFSPDSRTYAAVRVIRPGIEQALLSGVPIGPELEHISWSGSAYISPDNKHLVYTASSSSDPIVADTLYLDGTRISPSHSQLMSDIAWHKEHITYWVADYANRKTFEGNCRVRFVRVKLPN